MKFFYSTKIKFFLAAVACFLSASGFSQSNFNSAYSRFGLGVLTNPGSFTHFGMGGVTTPIIDPLVVNFANPASYAFLESTTMQITARGGYTKASTQTEQSKFGSGQISEMGFGFKKPGSLWGIAIGVSPYSSVDYQFKSTTQVSDSISAKYSYTGSGGLNKASVGTSRLFRFSRGNNALDSTNVSNPDTTLNARKLHQLALGVNANYIFGNITRNNVSFLNYSQYFATHDRTNLWAQGFIFEAGLLYKVNLNTRYDDQKRIKSGSALQIGADYSLNSTLSATYDQLTTLTDTIGAVILSDTSLSILNQKGDLKIPQNISFGFAIKTYNKKWGTLTIAADYKMQDWSRYRLILNSDAQLDKGLKAASTISVGLEYKPSTDNSTDLIHRLNYRLGARSTESSLLLNDTRIRQSGISGGISIPVIKSSSKFHLGAEYGSTGTTAAGLVKEDYLNFMIGFSLTPSAFDRWFRQVKYD